MFKRKHKNKHERMRDFLVRAFKKKVVIAKWQLNLFGLVCFFVGSVFGVYLVVSKKFPAIFAADEQVAFVIPTDDVDASRDVLFSQGTTSGTVVTGVGNNEKVKLAADVSVLSDPNYVKSDYQSDIGNTPGLVSYWKFDGDSNDSKGNKNLVDSNPGFTAGKINGGLAFDGFNDIAIGNGTNLNFAGAYSACSWFKTSVADSESRSIITTGVVPNDGTAGTFSFAIQNGKLVVIDYGSGSSDTIIAPTSVSDGNWHYGCYVLNGINRKIYLDGVLDTEKDSWDPVAASIPVGVGNRFIGSLDELSLFDRALSSSDITTMFNNGIGIEGSASDAGLVSGFHFNETNGVNISEYSLAGNNITLKDVNFESGKYGSTAIFNDNYFCAPHDPALDIDSFSVEMWINPSDTQQDYADIIDRGHGIGGWVLQRTSGNTYTFFWYNADYAYYLGGDGSVTLTPNVWQHLVITKQKFEISGERVEYYLNGVKVSESVGGNPTHHDYRGPAAPICIGALSTSPAEKKRHFNGKIDEFAIYNKVLSYDEITSHLSDSFPVSSSKTWESAPLELGWRTAWTVGDSFSANVAIPAGTSIAFELRTASTKEDLANATYVPLDNGVVTNGVFTADLTEKGFTANTDPYTQVRATLITDNASLTPEVSNITFNYVKDGTPPTDISALDLKIPAWDHLGNFYWEYLTSGSWSNQMGLVFSWVNASDDQAGVKGYCIYLGQDPNGDPLTQSGMLQPTIPYSPGNVFPWGMPDSLIDARTTGGKCQFIVKYTPGERTSFDLNSYTYDHNHLRDRNGNSISALPSSPDKYYLNVKSIDNNNNVSSNSRQIEFGYDDQRPGTIGYLSLPGGFVSSKDVTITWPLEPDVQASTDRICNNYSNDQDSDFNGCACKTFGGNGKCVEWDYGSTISGIAGFQYKIRNENGEGTWYGLRHNGMEDMSDLIPANQGSYTMQSEFRDENGNPIYVKDSEGNPTSEINSDFRMLKEGTTTIEFRVCDLAGNCNDDSRMRGQIKINSVAPSVPVDLQVTPNDSTSNAYAFSWKKPDRFIGSDGNKLQYCYTVNTLPSINSCIFTPAGTTLLPADAFASQPGENTFYLVAKDEAGNINYDVYASVKFTYSGSAPGIPKSVDLADISIKDTQNWKLVLSWDKPEQLGAGVSSYKIFRSDSEANCATNPSAFTQTGSTAGTSFADADLSQKKYYYCVRACDSANNCSASSATVSKLPTGKYTQPANLIDGPSVDSISTSKAKINWVTERGSDSKVSFGKESGKYYEEEPSNATQTKTHNISLNNLSPGTQYFYKAKWTDEDGNTGMSEEKSFRTDPAPIVKDVEVNNIGISSAFIKFTTKGASEAKLYYGRSTGFGGVKKVSTSNNESSYTVQLDSLNDGTKHYYKINTVDSEGTEYEGTTLDFTTLPRPKVSNVKVEDVRNTAQPEISVTWETNTETSSIITYYPKGEKDKASDEVNVKLVSGEHRLNIKNLLPEKEYVLVVKGVDKIGNEASSDEYNFTTASDTRPPMVSDLNIEGVIVDNINQKDPTAQLVVSWNTDEPATSQIEYGEGSGSDYAQKTQEDSNLTTNHLVIVSGLAPSKVYHLRVVSKDKAENVTNSIDNVTITPKAVDNALDLVIINLQEIFGFLANLRN
jgi:hypothetical protein